MEAGSATAGIGRRRICESTSGEHGAATTAEEVKGPGVMPEEKGGRDNKPDEKWGSG